METARIAALLEPFLKQSLSSQQLTQISMYIDLLLRWNARINLTAIRDPEAIVTRHFGESLFAAQTLFPGVGTSPGSSPAHVGTGALTCPAEHSSAQIPAAHDSPDADVAECFPVGNGVIRATVRRSQVQHPSSASHAPKPDPGSATSLSSPELSTHPGASPTLDLLDLGSGAGFPGLPIKLWAPHLRATLVESQNKKVAFLREVIRALTLTGIDVLLARAETLSARASVVTLRAVEDFESILPIAAKLVAPQGRLALLVGESQVARAGSLCPTFSWHPPLLVPQSSSRVLQIAVAP
jgi:16S rRNA G527 N7-methylase RsmG